MNKFIITFFSAVGFFTRIPIPKKLNYNSIKRSNTVLFLPVIGWIVGGSSALLFLGLSLFLPKMIAVIVAIAYGIFITSGFHEDGLADSFDGFGGGWEKNRILEIMKDSSIGTYGVLSLIISILLKIAIIFYLNIEIIPITILSSHTLSRALAASLMFDLQYAREKDSKTEAFTKKISSFEMIIIMLTGIIPMFAFNNHYLFIILLPIGFIRYIMVKYFRKWIDGYTGDCIGAAQQIFEVVILFSVLIIYYNGLIRNLV